MLRSLLASTLCLASVVAQADLNDTRFTSTGFVGYTQLFEEKKTGYEIYAPDLGLLLNAENKDFSLNLQLNYTGVEKVENILTYGFVQWSTKFKSIPIELQAGKFRYEHGLFGGMLTNPRLRPSIFPPQSIYFTPLAYNIRSAYGVKADIYYDEFELSMSVGKAVTNDQSTEFYSWINIPKEVLPFPSSVTDIKNTEFGSIFNVFLKHSTDNNLFKISYGQIHLNDFIGAEAITVGDQVTVGKFTASAEAMFINPDYKGADYSFFKLDDISIGWSATLGYEVTDDVKVSVNFNEYLNRKTDTVQYPFNDRDSYTDLNFGVIWNATDSLLIRGDIHLMNGSRLLPSVDTFKDNSYDNYLVGAIGFAYFFD
jgi:hypothetical protein